MKLVDKCERAKVKLISTLYEEMAKDEKEVNFWLYVLLALFGGILCGLAILGIFLST